jgi:hypothetical protein
MPSQLSRDSLNRRLAFQPDAENVARRVHVSIVRRAATRAFPAPYSKSCDAFRASDHTTIGAGLGSPSFGGLHKTCAVLASLVAEHVSEHRPASIRDGLCHRRLPELGGIHIADNDQRVFARNPGTRLVQLIAARIRDLGVNGLGPVAVSGPLSGRQCGFIFPVVLERGNGVAIAARRQRLEAKIYTDRSCSGRKGFGYLALKGDVPATTGILNKSAGLDRAAQFAGLPEAEFLAVPSDGASIGPHRPTAKRNPPQRPTTAGACAKARRMAGHVARGGELSANLAYRLRADAPVLCWCQLSSRTAQNA